MSRTNIPAQPTLGAYAAISPGDADLTFTGADVALGNDTALVEGKTLVLVRNTDVGAQTVTFTSTPDTFNRTGDVTAYSLGAGEQAMFGPFKTSGWAHSGRLWINGSNVALEVAVVTLP